MTRKPSVTRIRGWHSNLTQELASPSLATEDHWHDARPGSVGIQVTVRVPRIITGIIIMIIGCLMASVTHIQPGRDRPGSRCRRPGHRLGLGQCLHCISKLRGYYLLLFYVSPYYTHYNLLFHIQVLFSIISIISRTYFGLFISIFGSV